MSTAQLSRPERWSSRLLLGWSVPAFATFLFMLTHQSDDTAYLGRYSLTVLVSIMTLFSLTLLLLAGGWLLRTRAWLASRLDERLDTLRRRSWFSPLVLALASGAICGVWYLLLGNHLQTYALLRTFICASIAVLALALVYGGRSSLPAVSRLYPAWIGLGVMLIIAAAVVQFYPALLKADEGSDLSMAVNALTTGHLGPKIYQFSHPADYFGGLWTMIMAGWLKVFGVSLTTGRLYALALALISLGLLWKTAANLYDRTTAWYTVLVGAATFISLNYIRYHIHAAFWLSLGLFLYSHARKTDAWWAYLLLGFSFGMTIDSTPVAYCFGLGLGLAFALNYIRRIRTARQWFWPPFWFVGAGGALAILLYVVIHSGSSFAPDESTGSMLQFYVDNTLNGLRSGQYLSMMQQYLNAYLVNAPILFVCLILGIIVALRERTAPDAMLLGLYAAWTFIIIFAYIYFPHFYVIISLPVCGLLAGRGLARGIPLLLSASPEARTILTRAVTTLLAVWLVVSLARGIRDLSSNSIEDVVEVGRRIDALIPQDAVILAAEPYYFGLLDHPYFVGAATIGALNGFRNLGEEAAWAYLNPDAVVISEGWPEPVRSPVLMSYLDDQQFSLHQCYDTSSYGRVELWVKSGVSDAPANQECILVCNPRMDCP